MNTKFKVNEEVYVINNLRCVKVTIQEVIIRITEKGESTEYKVVQRQYTSDGKEKDVERIVKEAFIVKDLKTAKKSVLANLEIFYVGAKKQLERL